jgi:hypothetical protein
MSISTDLLAYYRCANANDEQGAYNATLSGVTITASGKYGDGWLYTGSVNDVATTSNITVNTAASGYSASCWVYNINNGAAAAGNATSFLTDNTGGSEFMPFYLGYGFAGAKKVFAALSGAGTYQPANLIVGGTQLIIDGSAAPYVNAWTHICVTAIGNTVTYYINGVATATAVNAGLSGTFNFSRIGNLTSGWFGKHTFGDRMDEIAIWGRVLSASEVTEIYNNEIHTLISGGTVILLPQGTNSQSLFTQGYALQAS